jgi:hypothetical protein
MSTWVMAGTCERRVFSRSMPNSSVSPAAASSRLSSATGATSSM